MDSGAVPQDGPGPWAHCIEKKKRPMVRAAGSRLFGPCRNLPGPETLPVHWLVLRPMPIAAGLGPGPAPPDDFPVAEPFGTS